MSLMQEFGINSKGQGAMNLQDSLATQGEHNPSPWQVVG